MSDTNLVCIRLPVVFRERHGARASSKALLCKQLNLLTVKVVTNQLSDLARRQEPSWFDYRSLAMDQTAGSIRLSQGLLVGSQH